jgi:NAD(P)-dependent dehydrogenase (short-subunit alcohol dehydrogenase family)
MDTIIITGAGSGIGAATARKLAEAKDVRIICIGRRAEPLVALVEELGEGHVAWPMDVASRLAWEELLHSEEVNLKAHPLKGVFANAGIGGPNAYGEGDRWDEIIRVNLTGVYVTVEACKPWLSANTSCPIRHVVVTSSVLARFGVPTQPAYVASKTGVLGLVRSWAVAWSNEGIRVNAICPGWVETEMAKQSIQALADSEGNTYEEEHAIQAGLLPTGHMSQPEEVAELVAWLMSNAQRSITGQAIDINNGSFMH